MDIPFVEQATRHAPGDFARDPDTVYLAFQELADVCYIDQYIPDNPLTLTPAGLRDRHRGATTGAEDVVLDGIRIDSPEAVVEHLERVIWPDLRRQIAATDPDDPAAAAALVGEERRVQRLFGPDILKVPYGGFGRFPAFRYGQYGYVPYFSAYALYPEVMERDFALQADLAVRKNAINARAYVAGGLPRIKRLDHDMADSRGTLVRVETLDKLWFPHFARSVQPLLDAGVRLLWHCDGNLMAMVPRLIECGIGGFQGFQYEDGMDYPRICRMKASDGGPLLIIGGVSVTRTLPFGTPADVAAELKWLVENGPPVGLFLGPSSSVAPGASRENIRAFIEGLNYYRKAGRAT